jgi:hypothetical protein
MATNRPRARLAFRAFVLAGATCLVSRPARGVDPFEIQVYDGTANAPGVPGLELHVNNVTIGPRVPPMTLEYPQAHQTHVTWEPSLGLFLWWEVGAYLQAAFRGTSAFDYGGVKLRNKFVTPPGWDSHWRLGLNVEFSLLPQGFDQGRWGNELRPIIAWDSARFLFVVNPIVDTAFAGPEYRAGPTFEPCLSAVVKIDQAVSLGVEYYANLGPFSAFLPWRDEEQYIYEVFNLLDVKRLEWNIGVGEGLTEASNRLVVKTIVGYAWEKEVGPLRASARAGWPR